MIQILFTSVLNKEPYLEDLTLLPLIPSAQNLQARLPDFANYHQIPQLGALFTLEDQ